MSISNLVKQLNLTKGLFTWSGGPRSSGVGFFCFHALGDTKQKKPIPLGRGSPTPCKQGLKLDLELLYSFQPKPLRVSFNLNCERRSISEWMDEWINK